MFMEISFFLNHENILMGKKTKHSEGKLQYDILVIDKGLISSIHEKNFSIKL